MMTLLPGSLLPDELLLIIIGREVEFSHYEGRYPRFQYIEETFTVYGFNRRVLTARAVCKHWNQYVLKNIHDRSGIEGRAFTQNVLREFPPVYQLIRKHYYLSAGLAHNLTNGNRALLAACQVSHFGLFRLIWEGKEKNRSRYGLTKYNTTTIRKIYRICCNDMTSGQADIIEYLCKRGYTNRILNFEVCSINCKLIKYTFEAMHHNNKLRFGVQTSYHTHEFRLECFELYKGYFTPMEIYFVDSFDPELATMMSLRNEISK